MTLFIQNKYTTWYYNIIQNAKSQSRKKLKRNHSNFIYYEKHHIIPKCMGGNNHKDNLVLLTAREHYIVHMLLTKMVLGSHIFSISYAFVIMSTPKNKSNQRYCSRLFESHRKKSIKNISGKNHPLYKITGKDHPLYGSKRTTEQLEKVSGKNNGMWGRRGNDHPMGGRTGEAHPKYGKKDSKETRAKKSKARIGKNNPAAKRCYINGIHFDYMKQAVKYFKTTKYKLLKYYTIVFTD